MSSLKFTPSPPPLLLPPFPFRPNSDDVPGLRAQLPGLAKVQQNLVDSFVLQGIPANSPAMVAACLLYWSTECPRFILADTYRALPHWDVLVARAYALARNNEFGAPALTPAEIDSAFKAFHIVTQAQINAENVPAQVVYLDVQGQPWPTMGQITV